MGWFAFYIAFQTQIHFTVLQARGLLSPQLWLQSAVVTSTRTRRSTKPLYSHSGCGFRVAALLAVRTSDTVRYVLQVCNGSGRVVAIVKGSGAYMTGKSGSGGSCTDVVHEIGKARTTVVCDRNNLHEARQRRGMDTVCIRSRDTWIRVDRAVD